MNDAFEKRVRAAAVAGWWAVLIAVAFLTLQWFVYLAIVSSKPGWFMSLLGPDITWNYVQHLTFVAIAALKFCVWLLALASLWLTLWARQLRKQKV